MDSLTFELSVFGAGCSIGLLIALWAWASNRGTRAALRKEINELKNHLHTQMSINAKGYEELKKELETLRKENENLRITVSTLSNKPGRAELKTLHIWDRAIRMLNINSPAFAPAWEAAIAQAKKEMEESDSGVKALVRKVFPLLPQDYSTNRHE